MFYGSIMIFFVWLMAQILTQLAVWGVSWGMGYQAVVGLLGGTLEVAATDDPAAEMAVVSRGAEIVRGWMYALDVVVVGFVYTFFWSSATIAYFVLRHSVDANDFDEVFVEESEDRDELLPLVGTPSVADAEKTVLPIASLPSAATDKAAIPPPVDLTP